MHALDIVAPQKTGSVLHGRGIVVILACAFLLAAMTANECHNYLRSLHYQTSVVPSLLFGAVLWVWWGVVALAMWWSAGRAVAVLRFSVPSVLGHTAVGSVVAFFHIVLLQKTLEFGEAHWPGWIEAYSAIHYINPTRFGVDLGVYGSIFAILGFLYAQTIAQQEVLRRLELEKQLSQAQLKALQMQLEPHFLFNSLNAVTSLVDLGRNHDASEALLHLNTILRSSLQHNAPEKIVLSAELRTVESYLAIQKVRFADRLELRIETTPEALEGLLPCFLLQPLIENAVQHGIAPMRSGGLVETTAERVGNTLRIEIRDNGTGASQSSTGGHGIGIRNTRDRLAHFYPGQHSFSASAGLDGGYCVIIQIPFERALTR